MALAVFALELLVCGLTPRPLVVVAAMLLAGPASGVACSFAQATLVGLERAAGRGDVAAERAASRWGLAAALGDVAAPALILAVGSGWRSAYVVAAGVAGVLALVILRTPVGAAVVRPGDDEDEAAPPPRFTLRELLASRRVLLAALAAAFCTFLDEIVLGIGALYLGDRFAMDAHDRSLVLGGWTVAALAGAAVLTVLVERVPLARLLLISGAGCGAFFASALTVDSPVVAALLLMVAGFFDAWQWPLCEALALREAGDRPLLAGAATALWSPLDLTAPFLVAAVAGTLGSRAAMMLLLVQPAVIVVAGLGFARAQATR